MPQHAAAAAPEHLIAPRTYVIVCVLLILLTVLTVGVSFAQVPPFWHVVIGLTIGVCKATLVVLFFMHAVISPRLTWIVIIVSVFWLGIMLGLTLTDYFSRGMISGMPGH